MAVAEEWRHAVPVHVLDAVALQVALLDLLCLLQDLAGNGMAVPVVLAIPASASISLSWRTSDAPETRHSTSEELENAPAILGLLGSFKAGGDETDDKPPKRVKTTAESRR